jgi:hypothetical protein
VVSLDFFGKKQGNVFPLDKRVMQRTYFAQFADTDKKAKQSLTPALDRLDSLIDPGGLLLVVVSHLFAAPVLVLWPG